MSAHIFNPDPLIRKGDRKRLKGMLISYGRLNEMFLINPDMDLDDIKRLVLFEIEGKARPVILRKLIARIKMRERKQLMDRVNLHIHANMEKGKGTVKVLVCSAGHKQRSLFDPNKLRQAHKKPGDRCQHHLGGLLLSGRPKLCKRRLRLLHE